MPPKTADPVDEIVTKADISTVIIKHGADNKEVIMKYVVKKLIKQIKIYWNRVYEKQIDASILALMTEKFVSSNSFPEFRQMHKHFDGNLPATMGHSNRQRPDGVIEFKFKNDICHLFIEVDADNKNNAKQREALKIWQDISCSVEGQTSSTSSGESLSACVLRINTHCINCSGVKHESVNKAMPSRKSTVPPTPEETDHVIGDEDKKLQQAYDTKHIDEVKQVFVTMHNAFARQITRVIWAWLVCVFEPGTNASKSAISAWITASTQKSARQDFCFWIGEYQIDNSLPTKIQTTDLDKNYDTNTKISTTDTRIPGNSNLEGIWTNIIDNGNFKGVEPGKKLATFQDLKLYDNIYSFQIDLQSDAADYIYKPFYSVNSSWAQETPLTKMTSNVPRSQGHWVRQLETFKSYFIGDDEDAISDWLNIDQKAFMLTGTNVEKTRGNFEEKTTVTFSNTYKEKCQFNIDVGLFGVKIPRVSIEDFEKSLNAFFSNLDETYQAYDDFNDSNQTVTNRTLYEIWQSFRKGFLKRKRKTVLELLKLNSVTQTQEDMIERYKLWVENQINYFEDAKKKRFDQHFSKLTGMWYSRHVAMILTKILQETFINTREFKAHILFRNTRQDKYTKIEQPNALPLAKLWKVEKALEWNLNDLRENDVAHLIPVLWDPLSGMLINAIYFFIRGIKQNSPSGKKHFETIKNQIRGTHHVYHCIKALMQADAILPDLLAGHDPDRISANSQNLNTLMLKSIYYKELKEEFSPSLKDYLQRMKSEHCVAFCKLIRCTDASMLHWTAKMYQNEEFKEEISRNIRLFPLAGQAMILRMLAEAAEDNPVVWKSNIEVQDIEHKVGSGNNGNGNDDEDFDDDLGKPSKKDIIKWDDDQIENIMKENLKTHKLYLKTDEMEYRIVIDTDDLNKNIKFDGNQATFSIRFTGVKIKPNRQRWEVVKDDVKPGKKHYHVYDRKCCIVIEGYDQFRPDKNDQKITVCSDQGKPKDVKWMFVPNKADIDVEESEHDKADSEENGSDERSNYEDDDDEEESKDSIQSDDDEEL